MQYEAMCAFLACTQKENAMKLRFIPLNAAQLLVTVEEEEHILQSKIMSVDRARHLANWFGDMYGWDNVLI